MRGLVIFALWNELESGEETKSLAVICALSLISLSSIMQSVDFFDGTILRFGEVILTFGEV